MRSDRRDFSPAWGKTAPLLAAGPWLRDVVRLPAQSRCRTADRAGAGTRHADPRTGVAINHEAAVIIFHDGWYYLLATGEACSAGANSSRDIRVGRSRKATGPFVDNLGIEMVGGELFGRMSGRHIGPDHFGLVGAT